MEKDTEAKRALKPERNENNENPEKTGKSDGKIGRRLRIGSLLAFLFLLLYIPSLLNWLKGDNIRKDILRIGTIEESVNADGVLVRDEILLEAAAFEGRYIPEVSEGERIAVASKVATILNKTSDSLLKELDEVNLKIMEARKNSAGKSDFFSEDMARLDTQIGQKVKDVIALSNNSSIAELGGIRAELDKLIEKKAEIAGSIGNDSVITPLLQQKADIQKRINSNTEQIKSDYSGIISYTIDGYEQLLSPKSLTKITPKQLEDIKPAAGPVPNGENTAHANKPLAKVIRGSDMYIAAVIDPSEAEEFKPDGQVSVRINDTGTVIKGVVSNISGAVDGKCVMIVRVNRELDVMSSARRINVDFISNSDEGLKVPLKVLRNISQDGSARIMLVKANVAAWAKVIVESSDKEYAIIRTPSKEDAIVKTPDEDVKVTVNLYDTYVINPDNIKEGDIID